MFRGSAPKEGSGHMGRMIRGDNGNKQIFRNGGERMGFKKTSNKDIKSKAGAVIWSEQSKLS